MLLNCSGMFGHSMTQSRELCGVFKTRAFSTERGIPNDVEANEVDENDDVDEQPGIRTIAWNFKLIHKRRNSVLFFCKIILNFMLNAISKKFNTLFSF